MAQKPRSSKPTAEASRPREVPIQRDTTFVRVGADDVIPVVRSRDYQLSFLARGHEPSAFRPQQGSDTPGATGVQPVLIKGASYELARVTVPHPQAFTLAMRIIDRELSEGRRKVDYVRLAIEGLLRQYEVDQVEEEAGAQFHEDEDEDEDEDG